MIKFVSYDGEYPNLCCGTLVMEIDGQEVVFPEYCLCSGGSVWFDDDYDEHVTKGPWTVRVPAGLEHLKEEIEDCVNENIPWGCCGGCV